MRLRRSDDVDLTLERARACQAVAARNFLARYMRAYEAEWCAFVQAVETGGAMPVTLQDGVNALLVAEAATLSSHLGRPVKIADGQIVDA